MGLIGNVDKKDSGARAGLFIFGGVMQYLEISRRGDSYRLEKSVDMPYDMGLSGSTGELYASQEVIESNLKALKKNIRKWPGKVYAGIQSKDVLLRTVDLPQMDLADIKEAFRFEFDRFFPIPVDDAIYDIAFIDRPANEDVPQGSVVNCIATALRQNTAENLMMASQATGLKLGAIEPGPVAMLRCLMGPRPPQGFNIYALAGIASSIIVATYRDNGIVYRNTTQSFAMNDPEGRMVAAFARDIQSTINFATTQIRGFSVDKVYIGGYGVNLGERLSSRVSEAAGAPVELVNPWSLWNVEGTPREIFGWETALGLALRPAEVR